MNDPFVNKTLRLVKNALIQFENENLIRISTNISDPLVFHKDLLLMLPDFFDWCNVNDFIDPIPEGQDQLIGVLKHLFNNGLLEEKTIGSDKTLSTNQFLPESLSKSESIFFNIHNHHLMIKDYVRATAYWHAIEANVNSDDIVLELGCGSGILTFFAARSGAKKLYAIEINKNMIDTVSRPLAIENGFDNKIEFLIGNSMNIPASAINPKPTVFIAEILGDGVFNENILSYTIDARERFLTPGAKMLPKGLDVYIFAYDNPEKQEAFVSQDIKAIAEAKSSKTESIYLKYDTFTNKMLSDTHKVLYIDLTTIREPRFEAKGYLDINIPGTLNGICLYFVAHIDDNNLLSNSPWSPQISWAQQLFNITPGKKVKKGDKVPFTMTYDGFLNLILDE